jgi:hypothetical protein
VTTTLWETPVFHHANIGVAGLLLAEEVSGSVEGFKM